MKITTNNDFNNEKTVEFEGITYKNIDDKFLLKNDSKSPVMNSEIINSYYLYEDNTKNLIAMYNVVKGSYNLYDLLTSKNTTTYGFDFKIKNRKELLKDYNISNDIDILEYIVKHRNDKPNIFSSKKDIQINYLIKTFANVMIPVADLSFISGDLEGYMYTFKGTTKNFIYEVHLVDNRGSYGFGFFNGKNSNYFTLNSIKEFLNNVHFND
jgi:hypothetical protein